MKLQGRNMQGHDVREQLHEQNMQIYGKITSKLASIFQHRQERTSDKETMK